MLHCLRCLHSTLSHLLRYLWANACAGQLDRNHRITEQVVIGTHGTLKNWMSKRILSFRFARILVFDEADEMLKVVHPPVAIEPA